MNSGKLPSIAQIKSWMRLIARKHGIPEQVRDTWRHSQLVWKGAKRIADNAISNGYSVNLRFLKAACLCHDIGRMAVGSKASRLQVAPIYHLFEGYRLCMAKGWPELARVCITHAGGSGLDKVTNREHGFIARDFFPRTTEEKIIAFSDACTSFSRATGPSRISFNRAYNRFKRYRGAGARMLGVQRYVIKITGGAIL
ncbi:MAG: HD domain-containing protein [Patescibacteria group bacterium]|nr:HD domain-containing protein [Patescibacteria group bacterium]MDD5715123.1 HD domain-containing protein [Patescibacteria group bacterium]